MSEKIENLQNPRMRPVGDLLSEHFFVPRYQRGYRWGKQEITELLNDILQYHEATQDRENKVSKFYCLQPVVVKRKEWLNSDSEKIEVWELIDGQQRLTTILLILNYLEEVRKILGSNLDVYTIDFETREECKLFFQNKAYKAEIVESNVDFYHISMAFKYIGDWFDEHANKIEVLNTLLKGDHNVSVIWYEAVESSDSNDGSSIELFTRLNDGKIPLTDAELIKALLLQADLYPQSEERFVKQRMFEIATEWDDIEAKLQDEKMWLFLNDANYNPSSKIEFLFKLLAEKWNSLSRKSLIMYEDKDGKPKHFEFLVFEKYLKGKREALLSIPKGDQDSLSPVNEIWTEIKAIFSTIFEWYNDHNLYHYIGFILINEKDKYSLVRNLAALDLTKTEFEIEIRKRVAQSVKIEKMDKDSKFSKQLSELTYKDDNEEIIKVLLLLNIHTLAEFRREDARFPFHLYKKENIRSIEHIHPQNPQSIDTEENRARIWLEQHKESLSTLKQVTPEKADEFNDLIIRIHDLLDDYKKEEFKLLYSDVLDLYKEVSGIKEQMHTLYNLALVDRDTNSQLNNSFFDIKRELLKENKLGRYIPICTHRAFSKHYSKSPQEMIYWTSSDRNAYFSAVESAYNSFVNPVPVKDEQ